MLDTVLTISFPSLDKTAVEFWVSKYKPEQRVHIKVEDFIDVDRAWLVCVTATCNLTW